MNQSNSTHICFQESRISKLETETAVSNTKIDNLIDRLDDLTAWVKALVITLIPTVLSAFGFLLWQFLQK